MKNYNVKFKIQTIWIFPNLISIEFFKKVFDSIGKPPSGLFLSDPVLGNFFFKGEHKQCIDKANGKYGLLKVITSSILPDTLLALIGNGAVTTIV